MPRLTDDALQLPCGEGSSRLAQAQACVSVGRNGFGLTTLAYQVDRQRCNQTSDTCGWELRGRGDPNRQDDETLQNEDVHPGTDVLRLSRRTEMAAGQG